MNNLFRKVTALVLAGLMFTGPVYGTFSFSAINSDFANIDYTLTGIPGGIPLSRSTISGTANAATYGNDSTDATSHLNGLLSTAGASATVNAPLVVYVPNGTYRINGTLTIPSNVTLRCQSWSAIIKQMGAHTSIQMGADPSVYSYTSFDTTISSGSTAGSASIVVASSTNISVGSNLLITETNAADVLFDGTSNSGGGFVTGINDSGTHARGQIVRVTSKSGTTLGITPNLYRGYSTSPIAIYWTPQVENAGMESGTLYATNSGATVTVRMQGANRCFMYNVKGDFTDGDHVDCDWSFQCEFRKCYWTDAFVHTSGGQDGWQLGYHSSACRIEDNILERSHAGFMVNGGSSGNFFAYNYVLGGYSATGSSGPPTDNSHMSPAFSANHGANPQYNGYEGNVGPGLLSDAYWGSSDHTIVFRNWFHGVDFTHSPYNSRTGTNNGSVTLTQNAVSLDVWELQKYFYAVGNVLGYTGITPTYEAVENGSGSTYVYQAYYNWRLGYTTSADTGGLSIYANPTATYYRHHNWTSSNGAVRNNGADDTTMPDSLVYGSKPSWFGSLTWPVHEATGGLPSAPASGTATIPAVYRFYNSFADPADTTAPTITAVTINANGTTATVTLSETSSNGAGGSGGWAISPSSGAATITYGSGSGSTSYTMNLSRTIYAGETATLAYTQPTNGVEDAAGNDLVTVSGVAVTNNSNQTQTVTGTRSKRASASPANSP